MKKQLTTLLRHILGQFTPFDLTLFKICLLACGVLFGHYLQAYLAPRMEWVWGVALVSYLFLMVRMVCYFLHRKDDE